MGDPLARKRRGRSGNDHPCYEYSTRLSLEGGLPQETGSKTTSASCHVHFGWSGTDDTSETFEDGGSFTSSQSARFSEDQSTQSDETYRLSDASYPGQSSWTLQESSSSTTCDWNYHGEYQSAQEWPAIVRHKKGTALARSPARFQRLE